MKAPAVFLDRDGTIVEQVHYLADPCEVRLIEDAAAALARLAAAGFRLVVVTNQSAIGRGIMSAAQYERVTDAMVAELAAEGATLDAIYHCPVVPKSADRTTVDHPDRKPGPGMLIRAARDHNLDLRRSWMVGDMVSDTLAGRNAGVGSTVLVRTGLATAADESHPSVDHVAADLARAAELILAEAAVAPTTTPRQRSRA